MNKTNKTPVPCPKKEELVKALDVLSDQFLHVYQLLYFNKLTTPERRPLYVERVLASSILTMQLRVGLYQDPNSGLSFVCRGDEGDKEILHKAKMLINGKGKDKPFYQACCCYAKRISCVCHVAMKCELHGETHIGTHD